MGIPPMHMQVVEPGGSDLPFAGVQQPDQRHHTCRVRRHLVVEFGGCPRLCLSRMCKTEPVQPFDGCRCVGWTLIWFLPLFLIVTMFLASAGGVRAWPTSRPLLSSQPVSQSLGWRHACSLSHRSAAVHIRAEQDGFSCSSRLPHPLP